MAATCAESSVYNAPATTSTHSTPQSTEGSPDVAAAFPDITMPRTPLAGVSHAPVPVSAEQLVIEQQAYRDQQCLKLIASIFALAYTARWIVCMLLAALSSTAGLTVLLVLSLLEHHPCTTLVAGFILWVVYGGHRDLQRPACLRLPVEPTLSQLASDDPGKGSVSAAGKQPAVNVAPVAVLDYSSVVTLHNYSPHSSVVDTTNKICYHVIAVADVASATDSVTRPPGSSIKTSPTPERLTVDDGKASCLEVAQSISVVQTTSDNLTEETQNRFSAASSSTAAQQGSTIIHDVPSVRSTMNTMHTSDDRQVATTGKHQNAGSECNGNLTTTGSKIEGTRRASHSSSSSGGTGSDASTTPVSSGSPASTVTLPSSEEGGINLKTHTAVDKMSEESEEDLVEPDLITATNPQDNRSVTTAELARLMEIHEHPKFCLGSLDAVVRRQPSQAAWSYYCPGETDSDLSGVPTLPNRLVSDDEKDINRMLQEVRERLPVAYRFSTDINVLSRLYRTRDGKTGLNYFMTELEKLWHQKYSPVIHGTCYQIPGLKDVHNFEKYRTRNHRPACPPGIGANAGFCSEFRPYLTDEQEVKVNQGCAEYAEPNEVGGICETLHKLGRHPAHAGARLDNPVLGWLDEMDPVEFYDANAYLPCACGKASLDAHLNFQHYVEPGYDPSQSGHELPQLLFLEEGALKDDQQRKVREEMYCSRTPGFPRFQTIKQVCELHATPTNKPWILMEYVEDLNDVLIGANNDLPVPGFANLTKYPVGFRMPHGFRETPQEALPPRCQHGYLHPPFVDHCVGCFPSGKHEEACAECDAHGAVIAVLKNPLLESTYEAGQVGWDRNQFEHVHHSGEWEDLLASHLKQIANTSGPYWSGWPPLMAST